MLHYRTGSMEEDYRTLFEPFKDIEAAGNKVYYEYYPYMVGAGLVLALVPGWAQQGSYAEIMERLTSKELRGKLLKDMDERHKYFFGPDQTELLFSQRIRIAAILARLLPGFLKKTMRHFLRQSFVFWWRMNCRLVSLVWKISPKS